MISCLLLTALFYGCARNYIKNEYYENGAMKSAVTYYDPDKLIVLPMMNGMAIYYDKNGRVLHAGEWKMGMPWNGECFELQAGDAGSAGGLGKWNSYNNGKIIK